MSSTSFLLRILLVLGLVLNGPVDAFASAHLHPAGHGGGEAQPVLAEQPATPCHDDEAGSPVGHPADAGPGDSDDPGLPGADCCQSGNCSCACPHGTAAMPVPPHGAAVSTADASAWPALRVRAAPALSHLIRPPIR